MMESRDVKRCLLIGFTILLTKIPLLASPYLLSESNYLQFNKFYYSGSLIILFGTFGFDFAFNFSKSKTGIIALASFVNVLLISLFINLIIPEVWNNLQVFGLAVFGYFSVMSGILMFRLLYTGEYQSYFKLHLIYAVILLLVILAYMFTGNKSITLLLPAGSLLSFLIVYAAYIKLEKEELNSKNLKILYSIGGSAFIINGTVPLLLTADKFIANHIFDQVTANAYTFSWSITAPLFYIGNTAEKVIYSLRRGENKLLRKSFLINGSLIIIYAVSVIILLNFFPQFLPGSADPLIVREISLYMLTGYGLYSILHFPVNGYLFKYKNPDIQKKIGIKYIALCLTSLLIFLFTKEFLFKDYRLLLLFFFLILSFMIIIKICAVWDKEINNHFVLNSTQNPEHN